MVTASDSDVKPLPVHRTPPSQCEYLPDESWQLLYKIAPDLQPSECTKYLSAGWRRMGPVVFRPDCQRCRKCLSLRVPVTSFRPSRTQRRILQRNAREVALKIACPCLTPDRLELYKAFRDHGHQTKGWPAPDDKSTAEGESGVDLFLSNPFPTEEWSYWIRDRLVGVGYVDVLAAGLSAIYFFHDPREHQRSLGTLNILRLIDAAGHRGLSHVYLGYYIKGCRSMEYKARFRPNDVFTDTAWKRHS